jgi:hypothetical protein
MLISGACRVGTVPGSGDAVEPVAAEAEQERDRT